MMMKITDRTAKALAWYASVVRVEAGLSEWDQQGVLPAILRATDRADDVEQLTAAVVRCALNPKVDTPAVIAMAGAHWETPATVHELRPTRPGAPLRDDERCPVEGHRQQPADWCSLCRGQWLGGDGWPEGTRHVEARRFERPEPEIQPDHAQRAAGDTD